MDTRDGEDFATWSTYRQVYNRCLAANFWSGGSLCGHAQWYRGKVVVISASSRLRRGWNYTNRQHVRRRGGDQRDSQLRQDTEPP